MVRLTPDFSYFDFNCLVAWKLLLSHSKEFSTFSTLGHPIMENFIMSRTPHLTWNQIDDSEIYQVYKKYANIYTRYIKVTSLP